MIIKDIFAKPIDRDIKGVIKVGQDDDANIRQELEDKDFNIFFRAKEQQSELVESWNDSTKRHLKSNYATCMTDANLLSADGRKRLITKPIIDNSLIWYLNDSGDQAILSAITGVI